jgi:hypothetical protein
VLLWLIAGTGITYNKDIIYAVSERGGVMVTIKEIAKIQIKTSIFHFHPIKYPKKSLFEVVIVVISFKTPTPPKSFFFKF